MVSGAFTFYIGALEVFICPANGECFCPIHELPQS